MNNISDLFRLCKIYSDLGEATQTQIDEAVIAHENYPDNDDAFEAVLGEQNYDAIDKGIQALEEIAAVVRDDEDLLIAIDDFINHARKIIDGDENEN
jgi:hypothetical protein